MEEMKMKMEQLHIKVREHSFSLWKKTKDKPRGIFLVKSATFEEFQKRNDFLDPVFVSMDEISELHQSVKDYLEKYDPREGFIYVIGIETVPPEYNSSKGVMSLQLVYKHADRNS